MIVKPCPICGRMPKIEECRPINSKRRRLCFVSCYHSAIPNKWHYSPWFIYTGDGDNNSIYKIWNRAITVYEEDKDLDWCEKRYDLNWVSPDEDKVELF